MTSLPPLTNTLRLATGFPSPPPPSPLFLMQISNFFLLVIASSTSTAGDCLAASRAIVSVYTGLLNPSIDIFFSASLNSLFLAAEASFFPSPPSASGRLVPFFFPTGKSSFPPPPPPFPPRVLKWKMTLKFLRSQFPFHFPFFE